MINRPLIYSIVLIVALLVAASLLENLYPPPPAPPPPSKVVSVSSSSSSPTRTVPDKIGNQLTLASVKSGTVLSFVVTAYCPCVKCCDEYSDGIFADGTPVGDRAIAAGASIPFGTTIYVPGYGKAQVKDRGEAITEGCLDLYFNDHKTAREWGVKILDCTVYYE